MNAPARLKLVGNREIKRVIAAVRDAGLPIGAIDIRTDGVTIHPPAESATGNALDDWLRQDQAGKD